jgi:phospholipid/cholesterol/gamma-HCH transport system substrate-binding protein
MTVSNETKVGILVAVVCVGLAVLTWKTGDFRLNMEGYRLTVLFDNIDGVDINSPVMLNGLEIGRVEDIQMQESEHAVNMVLTLWLDAEARLYEGARAYVKNMGFMGEKYVGLTSGDPGRERIGEGMVVHGHEPADLDSILKDAQDVVKDIKSVARGVNERLSSNKEEIDGILSNLNDSLANVNSISAEIKERMEINGDRIDEMVGHLNSTAVNLELFTGDLKDNPWKLFHRSKKTKRKHADDIRALSAREERAK